MSDLGCRNSKKKLWLFKGIGTNGGHFVNFKVKKCLFRSFSVFFVKSSQNHPVRFFVFSVPVHFVVKTLCRV